MSTENVPNDESEFTQELHDRLKAKMTAENPTFMHRDAHPKQHGVVQATFSVEQSLPKNLCHGAFKPGTTYKAWMRFSNQNAPPLDDYKKDIRGAAIKLMNVPGAKIKMPDGNSTSQDFVLVSTPVFVARSVKEFALLIRYLLTNKFCLIFFFLFHPHVAINIFKANKRFFSPLEARYWSTTPYRLGPNQVVKYSIIPHRPSTPITEDLGADYLKHNMAKQLADKSAQFDFCVQLQTNPKKMPVENPSKLWKESDSPFVKVATITIPQQNFNTDIKQSYGRSLSFNPWHSLEAHRPLGGINRARHAIYVALSKFRHDKNAMPVTEPVDYNIPDTFTQTTPGETHV